MLLRDLGVLGCRLVLCLACWLGAESMVVADPAPTDTASQQNVLRFGILPFESPVTLFKRFAPLRDHLSQILGRPVVLETAKDFPEFMARLGDRKYDIVLTAPHIALRTLDQRRYEAAARHTAPLATMIVVPEDSPIRDPAQLAGLRMATPPEGAIATMVGKRHLESIGLTGENALQYRAFRTHNAAFQAALSGQADAAMTANTIYTMAIQAGAKLRLLTRSQDFPGMAILTGSDLPQPLRDAIRASFTSLKDTPEGRRVLERISHPSYEPATASDFESLRPYLVASPSRP